MKTTIVDCQLLQTAGGSRGMGRYTIALLEGLVRVLTDIDLVLLFNSNLPMPRERLHVITARLPNARSHWVNLPWAGDGLSFAAKQKRARRLLDYYIGQNFAERKVDYLITSLFTFDYCAAFPTEARKLLLFYDLIPLNHWGAYRALFPEEMYFAQFKVVFEADNIFAISQTAARDLTNLLGVNQSRIVIIDGAFIKSHSAHKVDNEPIPSNYILMPTADMPHKNNVMAVEGFVKFNQQHGDKYTLLVTASFNKTSREELKAISPHIHFTGNVADVRLDTLFRNSKVVLFPSLAEGLGLPILEAVEFGITVACSDIPIFTEISANAFYLFDPYSAVGIAAALTAAVEYRGTNEDRYKAIRDKYTWERSASLVAQVLLEQIGNRKKGKARIALVTPSPSSGSKVSKEMQRLFGALSAFASVDVFMQTQPDTVHINYLKFMNPMSLHKFNLGSYCNYDAVVYGVDDSGTSSLILWHALVLPGFLCLGDTTLVSDFRALCEQGYISTQVINREEKLSATMFATLLYTSYGVLVLDESAEAEVKKVAPCMHVYRNPNELISEFSDDMKVGQLRRTFSRAERLFPRLFRGRINDKIFHEYRSRILHMRVNQKY